MATSSVLPRDFSLGSEQAEHDPLLRTAFYSSGAYRIVEDNEDKRCFLIGRTGAGKSAMLRELEATRPSHVIRIDPEDLSLPYITDTQIIRRLDQLEINIDPLFIALWKHVLLVELIRHRYGVYDAGAKANFLTSLKERIKKDPAKQDALEYLDHFQDRFWCEAHERVREIIENFEDRVNASVGAQLPGMDVGGKIEVGRTTATEERSQEVVQLQRLVNETQLPRLNKMIKVLDDDILDSRQHFTYIVIDDLDRDWVDNRITNTLIRCLFRSVVDLQRVQHVKILVALRVNIFQELEYERRIDQEEKLRSLVVDMGWTARDLEELLDERVRASSAKTGFDGPRTIKKLLPKTNAKRGDPLNFILGHTLMRPRDAISYVNEVIQHSVGKTSLSWTAIRAARHSYSERRLLALRDEWKATYPDIGRAFEVFRRCHANLSRDELTKLLGEIALLQAEGDFHGVRWLTDATNRLWDPSTEEDDWPAQYQPLLRILFNIGLIGCEKAGQRKVIYSYERPTYTDRASNLGPERVFVVHPAFRSALEIEDDL